MAAAPDGAIATMQRLVLAALILALIGGIVAVFVLGWRATARERGVVPFESEGSSVQKLAYVALLLLIAGVSSGLVGGL